MSGRTPRKPPKPPQTPPREVKRREPEGTVPVTPINPPAVGGGGLPRDEGSKKKK